jgi:translation initiation factor 2 alpha subunit (eIF-2alpha)
MELTEGSVVLCTVKKIDKTNIFLEIVGDGEASMVLSEVAAGRIRNLREYVFPNKKIVCKILTIHNNQIHLSLRRVTAKERDEVLQFHKKEKSLTSMLKTVVKNPTEIISKIKEKYDLFEFLEDARESPKLLGEFFEKDEIEKLDKILAEKIEKDKTVKKTFKLYTSSPTGIHDIKEILNIKNTKINYLGSSNFSIEVTAQDFKEANKKLSSALEQIENNAKSKKANFELKEK